MIDGQTVLALIPARGGSKGIHRKNLAELAGKPLISWTIDAAKSALALDRIVLSSEDDEIVELATGLGCEAPFRRPAELATDETRGMDVVIHALGELEPYDIIVLLQPTSPFRTASQIDEAVRLMLSADAPAVVSVSRSSKPPEWMFYLEPSGELNPLLAAEDDLTRRQDGKPVYSLNGAIYVGRTNWVLEQGSFMGPGTVAYRMPAEHSIDIDEPQDLRIAEALAASI